LYDAIISLKVVLADGSLQTFTRDDPKYRHNPDENPFHAFQIHLGCLGIVVSVTLECVPFTVYRLDKTITDFKELKEHFLEWNEDSEHCKAWWFPNTDHVQLWRTTVATEEEEFLYVSNNRKIYLVPEVEVTSDTQQVAQRKKSNPPRSLKDLKKNAFTSSLSNLIEKMDSDTQVNVVEGDKSTIDKKILQQPEARFQTVLRFTSLHTCFGNIYQLWCKGIPAPQINCELAVPMDKLNEVLDTLHEFYAKSENKMHYPFILRATGSSDAWLSPSHGKRVCYIGFLAYLNEENHTVIKDQFEFVKEIEKVISGMGALPHYGKFFTFSLYNFETLPKWKEFLELRSKLDPNGVFMNKFLNDLFHNREEQLLIDQSH
jgi:hypothetical protein